MTSWLTAAWARTSVTGPADPNRRTSLTRRAALGGLTVAALARPALAAPPFRLVEVAPGIHVRRGVHEEATAANADGIANIGFIVGRDAVAVIDPGGSGVDGAGLRRALRAVTPLPVRYVVLSHAHPDHTFGAGAFEQDNPLFAGHRRLAEVMVPRGEFYRNRLADILGIEDAGDYAMPTLLVGGQAELDLGGRALTLHAHGTAHTDADVSVWDAQTGTLWASDLLFVDRVPAVDGSILGWLRELDALAERAPARVVPGHGPAAVGWADGAGAQRRYLTAVVEGVRSALRRGNDIEAAVAEVAQDERGHWLLFDDYHGRNVTAAYKELEWE